MKRFCALCCVFLTIVAGSRLTAGEEPLSWEIRAQGSSGEVEYDPATGLISAPNGVMVTYKDIILRADKASANQETGEVTAEGNVSVKWEEANGTARLWNGNKGTFNYKTRELLASGFKTGREPFYLQGAGVAGRGTNQLFAITDATITTDDYAQPAYRLRAARIFLIPGDFIEAEDATLYLGNMPVFYFKHYRRSLQRHPHNWVMTPGYRSLYGPFLLNTYNWEANDNLDGAMHLDVRAKRGVAVGPEIRYDIGRAGTGDMQYYYLADQNPGEDPDGNALPRHRQRVSFTHRADIATNLTFKTAVRYQNDPCVIRDFFENEYRQNMQPATFAELGKVWPNWTLDALVQARVNDFFETVERLPDIKLTGLRQQLGETALFYESETSAGFYRRRFAEDDLLQNDFEAFRGDAFHQVVLPRTLWGWLNFTPRAGGRLSWYSEGRGAGATADEEQRGVFNTGAELSFKTSRTWGGVESKFWDVRGIRHILEPSVNYVFVPSPSRAVRELPQFDTELPGLRLLPVDYPDYNAIDSVDSQNVLRLGLRNKLQTKRKGLVENIVNWALYTDWRLDPKAGQGTFADLYSDVDFSPRSWLVLNSETRTDVNRGRMREANHRVIIAPKSQWSVTLGHRYMDEDPSLGPPPTGNNLFYDSLYCRFSENWAARMAHYFESRDGVMEEQHYTVYRDLRSWTAALTLRLREGRSGPSDVTVAVSFSLKAFPRFDLGEDRDQPWRLLGG